MTTHASSVSSLVQYYLDRGKRILLRGNPEKWLRTTPKEVASPEEALQTLDYIRENVDAWRASDGGLTNAACDVRWECDWAEDTINKIIRIKSKAELASIINKVETSLDNELRIPYSTCHIADIYGCVIAVGLYLLLKKSNVRFEEYPSLDGKIAVNMRHGKYCFGYRNPWYRDLSSVIDDKIFIYRWEHHDGADIDKVYTVAVRGKDGTVFEVPKRNITGNLKNKIIDAGYAFILR